MTNDISFCLHACLCGLLWFDAGDDDDEEEKYEEEKQEEEEEGDEHASIIPSATSLASKRTDTRLGETSTGVAV